MTARAHTAVKKPKPVAIKAVRKTAVKKAAPAPAKKAAAKPAVKAKSAAPAKKVAITKASTLKVRIGAVTVEIVKPTGTEILRNVKTGQTALKRAGVVFAKPGVTLPPRSNAPLYYADPSHPGRLVQEANGKKVVGQFVNGRFVAVKTGTKVRAA